MQKRSLPLQQPVAVGGRLESADTSHQQHPFGQPKLKSGGSSGKQNNEWGENFIMDRCGLPCVPSLKGRENVQFISLQHNLIARIDSLASFRTLKVLNLYDNKIERISGLDTLSSLRVLMLGKNRLKSTEGLESLQSLDILDLHGNQIGALTGVSRLKNLRVLNLAANSLKKLPSLEGLGSLEELNAKRNRISKIAPEVILAKRLERLYLSNNELRRLDDLSALPQLVGLKELSLDGNPLTFNAHYVLFVVSSLPSLVLLDQNVISPGLRHEAENWSLIRRFNNHQNSVGSTSDLTSSGHKGSNPLVTVQHKTGGGSTAGTPCHPLATCTSTSSLKGSSATALSKRQKNVAVVRPMSVQQETRMTEATGESSPPIKSCLVKTRQHKSFRQIAFSAMVCNGASSSGRQALDDRPVFRFHIRPPTAEERERDRNCKDGRRHRSYHLRTGEEDDRDSSSSWNSDSEDSDDEAASYISLSSAAQNTTTMPPSTSKPLQSSSSTAKPSSSPVGGRPAAAAAARIASSVAASAASRAGNSSPSKVTKLSATIGMNIKEQLRDLRIIVGEEEVHISGLNIIRMLHNMQWSSEEVELFQTLIFYGLSFDQVAPYYASLRALFPNLRSFTFRKVAGPPTPRHLNALAGLESPTWFRWITQLNVELSVQTETTAAHVAVSPETVFNWHLYAIYRLHPFGLEQIDGREVGPTDLSEAEDQYNVMDSLVLLTAPPAVIRRQLERVSSLETGQSPSSCSSSEATGSQQPSAPINSTRDAGDYAQLMRKRAIRNLFQPNKEAKLLRNRSPHLQYVADYGFEVAIKLSLLAQNWDRLLSDMIVHASQEVHDETAYKNQRLAHFRGKTPNTKSSHNPPTDTRL